LLCAALPCGLLLGRRFADAARSRHQSAQSRATRPQGCTATATPDWRARGTGAGTGSGSGTRIGSGSGSGSGYNYGSSTGTGTGTGTGSGSGSGNGNRYWHLTNLRNGFRLRRPRVQPREPSARCNWPRNAFLRLHQLKYSKDAPSSPLAPEAVMPALSRLPEVLDAGEQQQQQQDSSSSTIITAAAAAII